MKVFNQIEINGLSESEVIQKKSLGLSNSDIKYSSKKFSTIFFENVISFFNIVNLSVIIFVLFFYFYTQDQKLLFDTVGIFLVSLFNTSLAIYQENKAVKRLEKIDLLKNKFVNVIRDDELKNIHLDDIVTEDIVIINQGDLVSNDGEIIYESNVQLDESMLTGESEPVYKKSGDNINSGSICLFGYCVYKVSSTSENNLTTKIIESAKKLKFNSSPLLRRINKIFLIFVVLTFVMILIEVAFTLIHNIPIENSVRKISAFATFLLPEGLIFFSTINFYFGILRISKTGAIVQKLNAIDSFAETDIICFDKTGTLTENKISIKEILFLNNEFQPELVQKLLGTFYQCSSFKNSTIDALKNFAPLNQYEFISEIPFKSENKFSSVHIFYNDLSYNMYIGALEYFDLNNEILMTVENKLYRTVLFCLKDKDDNFVPICILFLQDEPRYNSISTINLLKQNQIDIKILSGDSKESVLGIVNSLKIDIPENNIHCRLNPFEKLTLIKKYKSENNCVAFIGDGLNDLPSIKESDLGISLEGGAEATKLASDIILLKNNFNILPGIFNEGRKIINSIFVISNLVIVKNIVLILLSTLVWAGLLNFEISPRNVSLWSLFAISFPAYFVAFKFSNISKLKNFNLKLFNLSILNAIILSFLIFISFQIFISLDLFHLNFVFIIMTFIAYFTIQLTFIDYKNKLFHITFGILVICLFVILNYFSSDIYFLKLIFNFYEINQTSFTEILILIAFLMPITVIIYMVNDFANNLKNQNE